MSLSFELLCAHFVLYMCHVSSVTHEGLLWSNPCISNPCINGECKAHVNSYKCICYPGFGGHNCELTACYKETEVDHPDIKIVSSPGYNQGSYPVMQICTWKNITIHNSPHVWISFNKNFSIERSRWLCPSPTYCCDYVSIYDGPMASDEYFIGQYCGTSPPLPFYSTTGSVSLMFYSDLEQWFERKGFLAYIGGVNDQKECSPGCIEPDFCYQAENASFVCGGICSDDFYPCLNNGTCTSNNFDFTCTCSPPFTGQRCNMRINNENLTDCQDLYYYGYDITGVQTIYPNGINSTRVLCEFDGQNVWTIIQNRAPNGNSNFNRSWSEYEIGFFDGDSYWTGLNYQKQLTNNRGYSLRVDLTDCKGNTAFSEYELFKLIGDNYTLTAENFDSANSIAGDSISPFNGNSIFNINGQPFSAFNKDNSYSKTSCARMYGSGWWWLQCSAFTSNLNGQYYSNCTASVTNGGIQWDTWKPSTYSYYSAKMKIRRNNS